MSTEKKQKTSDEEASVSKAKLSIYPYLFFPGTANEALDFYAAVFNAKICARLKFKDGPPSKDGVEIDGEKIMHAVLTFGDNIIMMSDNSAMDTTTHGTNVQLSISMSDLADAQRIFDALSVDGNITLPFAAQFWGATYGKVADKFGVVWGINVEGEKKEHNNGGETAGDEAKN